jgi:hypothetical protein
MTNVSRLRWPVILIGTLFCLSCIWTSGREGLGQLLAGRSAMAEELEPANQAVRLAPAIPETHYVRANLLADAGDFANSIKEYERAVALRPSDYALWLDLGLARDRAGDAEGAISAFRESVALAPFYSQPHWQLGNTLYRLGRVDEAVKELVIAASSSPKLASQTLTLLWPALHNDIQAIDRATAPQTQAMNLALARLLVKQGKIEDAMKYFRAAGGLSGEDQRVLIEDLLARKNFDAAYEVWSSNSSERKIAGEYFENGGFEKAIKLDRIGFGWQFGEGKPSVKAVLDPDEHGNGAYSMRIDWNGISDPNAATASQLILVNAKTRYRLSFAARTRDVITIGLPIVSVIDPTSEQVTTLGQPVSLPAGTSGWLNYSMEFVTGDQTRAARITIARANCASQPCPAFGSAWFDDFSLIKLGN